MFDVASILSAPPISPSREIGAYEAIWAQKNTTFKRVADLFRENPSSIPSEIFLDEGAIQEMWEFVRAKIEQADIGSYGVRIHGTEQYPQDLRDADHPLELFYYQGDWSLVESPKRVAIVGARNASHDGIQRARKLTKLLVEEGFVIFSGLAKGIDYAAHMTAMEYHGHTVAVIGTPITEYYPQEHKDLQRQIARDHLLISQVPIHRYAHQDYRWNRLFFPERNTTMSALTQATIIVEAGETSGSLTQARAALKQGRKLFILESCFKNPNLTWPTRFEKLGAIRVSDINDILQYLVV